MSKMGNDARRRLQSRLLLASARQEGRSYAPPLAFTMRDATWIGRTSIISYRDGVFRIRVDGKRDVWITELEARLCRVADAALVDDAPLDSRARYLAAAATQETR